MSKRNPKPTTVDLQKRRMRELELLVKSSHTLNSTLDLDVLVNRILKTLRHALSVETASVLFPDASGKNLVFKMARGHRGRQVIGLEIPMGEGVAGWVAKNKKPLIVNDLQKDKRYSLKIDRESVLPTRSIMSIPLLRRNKLIGVVEAINRPESDPFTQEDLNVFIALGDQIATAIDNAQLYRDARHSRAESAALYQVSLSLSKALTLDQVLEEILTALKKLIGYDAAAIFVIDRKNHELVSSFQVGYRPGREDKIRLKLDEGVSGWAARNKKSAIVDDTSSDKRYVEARRRTKSEMVAPMLTRDGVIGLFNLESNRLGNFSQADLRLLDSFAAMAGVTVERAQLFEEQKEKHEIERELKTARTVQEFFTPLKTRRVGGFTLTGRNYPSLELSGDYLDFFPLQPPFEVFAVADVAGKGVPAAIVVAGLRATLHTAAPHHNSARELALRANQILLETVRPYDFVTGFIGVLNYETGEVSYVNAGHEPPILMRPNGRYSLLKEGGPVLGVFEDNKLDEGHFTLSDQLFFAFTDGLIDTDNPKGQPFGTRRLINFIRSHRTLSPARIATELRKHLREFSGGTPQVDDLTFLIIKK